MLSDRLISRNLETTLLFQEFFKNEFDGLKNWFRGQQDLPGLAKSR
jgi:hypothetical protein